MSAGRRRYVGQDKEGKFFEKKEGWQRQCRENEKTEIKDGGFIL